MLIPRPDHPRPGVLRHHRHRPAAIRQGRRHRVGVRRRGQPGGVWLHGHADLARQDHHRHRDRLHAHVVLLASWRRARQRRHAATDAGPARQRAGPLRRRPSAPSSPTLPARRRSRSAGIGPASLTACSSPPLPAGRSRLSARRVGGEDSASDAPRRADRQTGLRRHLHRGLHRRHLTLIPNVPPTGPRTRSPADLQRPRQVRQGPEQQARLAESWQFSATVSLSRSSFAATCKLARQPAVHRRRRASSPRRRCSTRRRPTRLQERLQVRQVGARRWTLHGADPLQAPHAPRRSRAGACGCCPSICSSPTPPRVSCARPRRTARPWAPGPTLQGMEGRREGRPGRQSRLLRGPPLPLSRRLPHHPEPGDDFLELKAKGWTARSSPRSSTSARPSTRPSARPTTSTSTRRTSTCSSAST